MVTPSSTSRAAWNSYDATMPDLSSCTRILTNLEGKTSDGPRYDAIRWMQPTPASAVNQSIASRNVDGSIAAEGEVELVVSEVARKERARRIGAGADVRGTEQCTVSAVLERKT